MPLFRYGTHQTIIVRLEQVHLPSDPRLEWPGEGPLFEFDLNKCQEGKMWALFESPPGPLFMSGQIGHRCKSSYLAEYVYQIC